MKNLIQQYPLNTKNKPKNGNIIFENINKIWEDSYTIQNMIVKKRELYIKIIWNGKKIGTVYLHKPYKKLEENLFSLYIWYTSMKLKF